MNVLLDGRWNAIPDGLAVAYPIPDLSSGKPNHRDVTEQDPRAPRQFQRWDRIPGTPEYNKSREFQNALRLPPGVELRHIVHPDEKIELIRWAKLSEKLECVDSVRDATSLKFNIQDLEGVVPPDREPNHRQPMLAFGNFPLLLVRRNVAGDEGYAIQVDLLAHVLGHNEVADVRRIECTAEHSDFHTVGHLIVLPDEGTP